MTLHCPRCDRRLVMESKRVPGRFIALEGGPKVEAKAGQAPKVRCLCGLSVVLFRQVVVPTEDES